MSSIADYHSRDKSVPYGIKSDGTPYKVLIVDDSIFIAKQLTQYLTSEGFEIIDTANDGADAVTKYKALGPDVDLITMDITMPNVDGITALEQILNYDSDARVLMISAIGKQDLVKKSLLLGAKNFITKPFDREAVLERVGNALK